MTLEKIYLILTCILIAILLVSSRQPPPDCYESFGRRITNITHPCSLQMSSIPVPNITNWSPPIDEFKLKLLDPEKGILSVKFPVPDELKRVEVILLLNKSAKTEEECKDGFRSNLSTHSKKILYRDQCTLADPGRCSSCETVYLETELQFVFTGCYLLKVTPRLDKGIDTKFALNRYSHYTFIKSSYEMTYLETPNMTFEYSPIINVTFIKFTSPWIGKLPLLVSMAHAVEPLMGNQSCQTSGIVQSCCSSHTPNITAQQCETINPKHKRPECAAGDGKLTCHIYNVTPGNYCMRAEVLNDDRCDSSTVWGKGNHSCIWVYYLAASGAVPPTSEPVVSPYGSMFYIYIVLGTVVSLVLLAAIIRFIRSKDPSTNYPGPGKPNPNDKILPKEKVLLLYAHDCSHFMDLMATFRNILQKVYCCEVYDIFDPRQWNTVAIAQHEWVQRLLSKDDIMIIVVDSTSAVLHQNALENSYSINYFQPRPNSHLFTYALQTITNNVQRNPYKRIFVIRFNGFSEDGQTLRHIAPLRRYLLPDHLHQLLSNLKESSCVDVEDTLLDELRDMGDLQRQLDSLIRYKAQNPEYLRSLLYRTSKVV